MSVGETLDPRVCCVYCNWSSRSPLSLDLHRRIGKHVSFYILRIFFSFFFSFLFGIFSEERNDGGTPREFCRSRNFISSALRRGHFGSLNQSGRVIFSKNFNRRRPTRTRLGNGSPDGGGGAASRLLRASNNTSDESHGLNILLFYETTGTRSLYRITRTSARRITPFIPVAHCCCCFYYSYFFFFFLNRRRYYLTRISVERYFEEIRRRLLYEQITTFISDFRFTERKTSLLVTLRSP